MTRGRHEGNHLAVTRCKHSDLSWHFPALPQKGLPRLPFQIPLSPVLRMQHEEPTLQANHRWVLLTTRPFSPPRILALANIKASEIPCWKPTAITCGGEALNPSQVPAASPDPERRQASLLLPQTPLPSVRISDPLPPRPSRQHSCITPNSMNGKRVIPMCSPT